ncbi:MAG: hypothetical protein WD844_08500 [Thermoleophilaceae bacterium]
MRRAAALLAAGAAVCALPAAPAAASTTQLSILQDDGQLLDREPAVREARLDEFRALGADVVKINVDWRRVAPAARPSATADPASYDAVSWAPFDAAIAGSAARGMRVLLTVGGPAPDWAAGGSSEPVEGALRPDAAEFGQFVRAVGARYSGSYRPPAPEPAPGGGENPVLPPLPFPPAHAAQSAPLPRVSLWSVWNEPNLVRFLQPQRDSRRRPLSPHLYRDLYLSAHGGLSATGHGRDTILLGELLPVGKAPRSSRSSVRPLEFLRELACVDRRLRPYRGGAARRRGCDGFRALPGSGVAVHPYTSGISAPPRTRPRRRDDISISTLSRLTGLLDSLGSRKRLRVRRAMPVWLTEFGFQTDPPERFGADLRRVPAYMAESEYIAWRNRRVKSVSQYPLVDDGDSAGFQSGLRFHDGRAKPHVYRAYEMPLHARRASRRTVELFGGVRAASGGSVRIESRRRGRGWRRLGSAKLNRRGYFRRRFRVSGGREYRIVSGGRRSNRARA